MQTKLLRPQLADLGIVWHIVWRGVSVWRLLLTMETHILDTTRRRIPTVAHMHRLLRCLNLSFHTCPPMKTHVTGRVAKLRRAFTMKAREANFTGARHAILIGGIAFRSTSRNICSVGITHHAVSAIIARQKAILRVTHTGCSKQEKEESRRYHGAVNEIRITSGEIECISVVAIPFYLVALF